MECAAARSSRLPEQRHIWGAGRRGCAAGIGRETVPFPHKPGPTCVTERRQLKDSDRNPLDGGDCHGKRAYATSAERVEACKRANSSLS